MSSHRKRPMTERTTHRTPDRSTHCSTDPTPLRLRDRLEGMLARALGRTPGGWLRWLNGTRTVTPDGRALDAHVQLLLHARARKGTPGLCEPDPVSARARLRREVASMTKRPTRVGRVEEMSVPGGDGVMLRARHYVPAGHADTPRPLLVYFHGGGFVIGDLDTHDEPCRLLCHLANTHVLSVAYRLAPEFPFPSAVNDSMASLRWALEHASALGAIPSQVAVGGDSAGANLATVAALALAEEGRRVAAQLLIYPITDSTTRTPSREQFAHGFMLEARDMDQFGAHYLGDAVGVAHDPRVSPRRAPNLALAPPTLIVTAGFDPLRDDGSAYAQALRHHGVTTQLRCEESLVHGFLHLTAVAPRAMMAVQALAADWVALTQNRV